VNYIPLKERVVIPALMQVDAKFSKQPASSVFILVLYREDGGKMCHRNGRTHLRHYTGRLHVFSYSDWPLNCPTADVDTKRISHMARDILGYQSGHCAYTFPLRCDIVWFGTIVSEGLMPPKPRYIIHPPTCHSLLVAAQVAVRVFN